MQYITKNSNNDLYFTLTERVTIEDPKFLVRIEGRSSHTIKRFILPANESAYPSRYDKFTITETSGTEILTSGTISLTSEVWSYKIYEQTSSTNLNELIATNTIPLEDGLLTVLGDSNAYTAPLDEKEYKYPTS